MMFGVNECFASSARITNSSGTITKGNSVNVSVIINTDKPLVSIEGNLVCSGAVSKTFSLNFDDSSNSLTSKTFTYTLTPGSSGTITCHIVDTRVTHMGSSNWENLAADRTVITVNEPPVVSNNSGSGSNVIKPKAKSTNNFLTSLSVEGLKFDSEFDKEKLEYSVTVPADIEKIKINGQLADSKATVSGLGEVQVKTGLNTFEIVVTAENGNKKTYVVKANVLELLPTVVSLDKEEYTLVKSKKDLPEISEYYTQKEIQIGEELIPGYYSQLLGYNLVALRDKDGKIQYYIYENGKYTLYQECTFGGKTLQILDRDLGDGYRKTAFNYGTDKIVSYQTIKLNLLKNTYALDSDEVTGNQFYLFYAKNLETGKESLYQYDATEKTVQRFNNELIDMYRGNSDTYYMYLLVSLLVIGILFLLIALLLIKNGKRKKQNNKKIKHQESE